MDAQRLLKTSALLPVIALLIAAPGWAQTLQAPPSVTIGNTGFNTAPVTSSDAGTTNTAISFTIATSTAGDTSGSGNWLRSEEHTSELQSLTNLVCRLL